MGLPGQAGGEAVADLLCGRANPSGKLAESWPQSYADVPSSELYGKTDGRPVSGGRFVGYRYYGQVRHACPLALRLRAKLQEFDYSSLTVNGDTVSVAVKNTGSCRCGGGAALMSCPQNGLHRPLRGAEGLPKGILAVGRKPEAVTFPLTDRSFAVWQDGWKIPLGNTPSASAA